VRQSRRRAGFGAVGSSFRRHIDCTGLSSCDDSSTGGKVYGGYDFGNGFGAEVGYIAFGKARASDAGISADIKVDGFTVAAAFRAPLGQDFGLTARLGVATLKSKISASLGSLSGSDDETHTAAYVGIAGDYALTKNLKLELSADFSRAKYDSEEASVRTINAGIRYDF
jgi:OOP family OmpA-OmpF porin